MVQNEHQGSNSGLSNYCAVIYLKANAEEQSGGGKMVPSGCANALLFLSGMAPNVEKQIELHLESHSLDWYNGRPAFPLRQHICSCKCIMGL